MYIRGDTMRFIKGMRDKIGKYINETTPFVVDMDISGMSEYDCCCFGVNAEGKLSDEAYMVFYNQTISGNNAIKYSKNGSKSSFEINLTKLPSEIVRLVFGL